MALYCGNTNHIWISCQYRTCSKAKYCHPSLRHIGRTSRLADGSLDNLFCLIRSGLALRAQPLVGNLDLFSSKPKTNSASSRHHVLHRRPRHDKRLPSLSEPARSACRAITRGSGGERLDPFVFASNVRAEGQVTRPCGCFHSVARPGSLVPSCPWFGHRERLLIDELTYKGSWRHSSNVRHALVPLRACILPTGEGRIKSSMMKCTSS
jgi:hypothetical protein